MVGVMQTSGELPALDVCDLSLSFGRIEVLRNVNLQVPAFGITVLIGPNGAGKTALLNAVTGIYHPQSGGVLLEGEDITGLPAHVIADKGIGRSFQHLELFQRLSVMENSAGLPGAAFFRQSARHDVVPREDRATGSGAARGGRGRHRLLRVVALPQCCGNRALLRYAEDHRLCPRDGVEPARCCSTNPQAVWRARRRRI